MPASVPTLEMATTGATMEGAPDSPPTTGAATAEQSSEHMFVTVTEQSANRDKAASSRGMLAGEAKGLEVATTSAATERVVKEPILTSEQAVKAAKASAGFEEDRAPLSRVIAVRTPVQPTKADLEAALERLVGLSLHGSVDTGSSSVDTRSSSQKTCLAVLDSVSTLPEVVSTQVTLPREPIMPVWDSVSTHSEVVSTHSG
ncbi:hypothetical protein Taro_040706 [Colocasia esculenta]|uniref:Uncharacterized protein n=1 Tax=Colocasia esculenta TaxID=4460 RepID=A0A843WTS9_COLES|nr:hypothetical protein [Colocasia esculenta]